jgi:hypothetical protein
MISSNQPDMHLGKAERLFLGIHQNDGNAACWHVIPILSSPYNPVLRLAFGASVIVKLKPASNTRHFLPPG